MIKYYHREIESKWQKFWQQKKVFLAKDFSKRPKKYILVEFPYPSGEGLHMGHLRPYVAADVYTRFCRMRGNEVIFPIGWDAFGLPAENYAIKMGVQPSVTTAQNIKNAKKQMQSWGLSFDWSREINTTDPNYFKWTQWLFLQFYKAGLAYESTGLINWCPKDKTGLANEEVIDGKCERCGTTVEKKELRQWYLKITAYAEKLLEGLQHLPQWPEAVKLQQKNWIGKKMGINITYDIDFSSVIARSEQGEAIFLNRRHSEGVQPTEESQTRVKEILRPSPIRQSSGRLERSRKADALGTQDDAKRVDIASAATTMTKPNFVLLHGYTGRADKNFLPWIKSELQTKGFEVQCPQMPNTDNPRENEQVEYVLKNCRIDENTILVGHSLGGVVAMKVLQKYNKKITGLVLFAPAIEPKYHNAKHRPFWDYFSWKDLDYEKLKKLSGFRVVVSDLKEPHRKEYLTYLAKQIGAALITGTAQREHFTAAQEPFLLQSLLPRVTCFTTRPDTNFGATFVVLGPEHPLLKDRNILNIEPSIWQEILKYQETTSKEADEERTNESRKKTGVFTGLYCINQLNNYKMPFYVADYVLGNVGTGAVVGVPGHDKRDFEFAQVFNIPVVRVVQKDDGDNQPITSLDQVQEDEGTMVNSDFLNGLNIHAATEKIMDYMEEKGYGKRVVNYKLRDWVFSRQRYWGEPIPIIHCPTCGIVPVPDKDLPVKLPSVKKYEPTGTGESPLAAISKWVNVKCPVCKSPAKRETNTMPQWAGSSWYWLRYTDPKNKKSFADLKKQKYWTPVDVYFGGMEHTTLHLLYSRFWNNFLYDKKLVSSREPFVKRKPHGIILGPDGEKMSKSRGNVVNPQDIVASHGADTLRMFELFLGPHEDTIAWNSNSVVGVKRFLDRVWGWVNACSQPIHGLLKTADKSANYTDSDKIQRPLNKLIKKITEDIENFHFNTCVSAFMEFFNKVKDQPVSVESVKTFLKLLYPFAPHISEELNQFVDKMRTYAKYQQSLQQESWPKFDPALIIDRTVEIVVQINGKVKGKISVPSGSDENTVKELSTNLTAVKFVLKGQTIKRTIFVPDRLINLVI